jgi:uncharacterized protein YdcH (DUF465 family)
MGTRDTDPNGILVHEEDYKRLIEKHRRCDARLQELQGRHHPSGEEQLEEIRIKKEKLLLKDQMAEIERKLAGPGRVATG